MLFSSIASKSLKNFIILLEENIDNFGQAIIEKKESCHDTLTDEEFVECYVDGMNRVIKKLDGWAYSDLKDDTKALNRYELALKNPSQCGFKFSNDDMTIGKIYLFYIWAKTKKKASKSDCIKLEKHAVRLIQKQCIDNGIVS